MRTLLNVIRGVMIVILVYTCGVLIARVTSEGWQPESIRSGFYCLITIGILLGMWAVGRKQ